MCTSDSSNCIQVQVDFFEQHGIGEISTLLPPIVKLLCAVVRRNELMQQGKPARLLKGERPQQQRFNHAKYARIRSNTDGECGDRKPGMPGTLGPEPKRVLRILNYFAGKLRGNRNRQIGNKANPE